MTKEELARKLNGREYTEEMTEAEEAEAKAAGLIVIFGASDDLCELRGAICDEAGVSGGGTVLIGKNGKLMQEIESDALDVLETYGVLEMAQKLRQSATKIEAEWCSAEYSWTYKTTVPHATFDVMEDGDKYCRGIVLDMKDVRR